VLVNSGANVLILDEPTNHLDLESREALEEALSSFEGSLLLVSHDRALLDAVGTRTISFEDADLRSYTGGWPEYLRVREELAAAKAAARSGATPAQPAKAVQPASTQNGANKAPKPPKPPKPSMAERKLEARIEVAEAALQALEDELAGPEAWSTAARTAASTARHAAAKAEVEALYEQLEQVAG
jgi:ATP-binding cassette subfamily F protein 3